MHKALAPLGLALGIAACAHLFAPNIECIRWEQRQVLVERCTADTANGCAVKRQYYETQNYCAIERCVIGYYPPDNIAAHGCYAGEDYDRRRAAYLASQPPAPIPVYDQGQANGDSGEPAFSPDGNRIVFTSSASNLVPGDDNGVDDIYMKDLRSGAVVRVSVAADGGAFTANAQDASFSADGTKVSFVVRSDFSTWVKDLKTQELTRTSAKAGKPPAALAYCGQVTKLSSTSDGKRQVANCFSGGDWQAYLVEGATLTPVCPKANKGCMDPVIARDGSRIAFLSASTNLAAADATPHIYVSDHGTMRRVSTSADGTPANGRCANPAISPDGTRVAFRSEATNLVDHDTNLATDVFVKNLETGEILRVSSTQ